MSDKKDHDLEARQLQIDNAQVAVGKAIGIVDERIKNDCTFRNNDEKAATAEATAVGVVAALTACGLVR